MIVMLHGIMAETAGGCLKQKCLLMIHGLTWAQVPLGAGLGFKHKYKNDGHVAITIYGDGAQNQGQVFEVRFTVHDSFICYCRACLSRPFWYQLHRGSFATSSK